MSGHDDGVPVTEALDIRIVSLDGQPFPCLGNILVAPHAAIADAGPVDAVVICDMYGPIQDAPRDH